jgi:hypothetical protein
MRQNL